MAQLGREESYGRHIAELNYFSNPSNEEYRIAYKTSLSSRGPVEADLSLNLVSQDITNESIISSVLLSNGVDSSLYDINDVTSNLRQLVDNLCSVFIHKSDVANGKM